MSETQKETVSSFILKVLNGATIAIVVALILTQFSQHS